MYPNSFYILPQSGNRYPPGPVVTSAAVGNERLRPETVPAVDTSHDPQGLRKPSCSYTCLIGIALLSNPTGCLPVNEIYRSIEQEFPYFRFLSPEGWKNCVRHSLSVSGCFLKFEKKTAQQCKSKRYLWGVNPEKRATLLREATKVLPGFENKIMTLKQHNLSHHAYGQSFVPDYGRDRYIAAPSPVTRSHQPASAQLHTIQYHPEPSEYIPQYYTPPQTMTPAPVQYLSGKSADYGTQYYVIKSSGSPAVQSGARPRTQPISKSRVQAARRTSEWVLSTTQPELIAPEESTIFELHPTNSATPSRTVHYTPNQPTHVNPLHPPSPEPLDNDWLSELLSPHAEETEIFKLERSDVPSFNTSSSGLMQPADKIPKVQLPPTPGLSLSDPRLMCRTSGSTKATLYAENIPVHQQTENSAPRDVIGVDLDSEFLESVDLKTYVDNDQAVAQFESSLLYEEPDTKKSKFPPNVICTSGTFSSSDRIPEDDVEISSLDLASAIAIDGILARISKDLTAYTDAKNKLAAATNEQKTGPSSGSFDRSRYTHTCVYTSTASYAPQCTDSTPSDHSSERAQYTSTSVNAVCTVSPAHSCGSSTWPACDQPAARTSEHGQKKQVDMFHNTVGKSTTAARPCSADFKMAQTTTARQVSEVTRPNEATAVTTHPCSFEEFETTQSVSASPVDQVFDYLSSEGGQLSYTILNELAERMADTTGEREDDTT